MQNCPVCGEVLPEIAHFCGRCGHNLSNVREAEKKTNKESRTSKTKAEQSKKHHEKGAHMALEETKPT